MHRAVVYVSGMIDRTTEPSLVLPRGVAAAFEPGWVWLVGAGPGDPGLLTLHALFALQRAEVIVHDALIDRTVLAWADPGAEILDMGKRGGKCSPKQRQITDMLVAKARTGRRVLRLKGGDPFVFGRGAEEAEALAAEGVPFRLVPGVTAGIGGLAYAGIPATHRDVNQSVTFVTGHDQHGRLPGAVDWEGLATSSQVLVLYMAVRTFPEIAARLLDAGRSPAEPVAIVSDATRPGQAVLETTLARAAADLAASRLAAPAIICIGEVVSHRAGLDWVTRVAGASTEPGGAASHRHPGAPQTTA